MSVPHIGHEIETIALAAAAVGYCKPCGPNLWYYCDASYTRRIRIALVTTDRWRIQINHPRGDGITSKKQNKKKRSSSTITTDTNVHSSNGRLPYHLPPPRSGDRPLVPTYGPNRTGKSVHHVNSVFGVCF